METFTERMAREDGLIKEMEKKLGQPWQTAVLGLVNAACAHVLNGLWEKLLLAKIPDYGDWEYPGQAYNHILSVYEDQEAELAALRERCAALEEVIKEIHQYDWFYGELSKGECLLCGTPFDSPHHADWCTWKQAAALPEEEGA